MHPHSLLKVVGFPGMTHHGNLTLLPFSTIMMGVLLLLLPEVLNSRPLARGMWLMSRLPALIWTVGVCPCRHSSNVLMGFIHLMPVAEMLELKQAIR